MCLCACECMCVCAGGHVWVCPYMCKLEDNLRCLPQEQCPSPLFTHLELMNHTRWAGQWASGMGSSCICLPSTVRSQVCAVLTSVCHYTWRAQVSLATTLLTEPSPIPASRGSDDRTLNKNFGKNSGESMSLANVVKWASPLVHLPRESRFL